MKSTAVFKKGARVVIQWLSGSVELDGACGHLRHFDQNSDRWELDIEKFGFRKATRKTCVLQKSRRLRRPQLV